MRSQGIVSVIIAYALYITVKCPCERTLSCHLPDFFGSLGLASFLVIWENGGFMRVVQRIARS